MDKTENRKIWRKVYDTLWGSSEVPENWMISFLLSNAIYILYGIILLLKVTGDEYDNDRYLRAWLILLVGFVSTMFHSNQVIHGREMQSHMSRLIDLGYQRYDLGEG
jgi:hypothetical protein